MQVSELFERRYNRYIDARLSRHKDSRAYVNSFILPPQTALFDRRSAKLVSTITSTFTAFYVYHWPEHFPSTPLHPGALPTFDGRAVVYPTVQNLRDYLSWRQVDCHINNLYNTTFWALVERGGMSPQDAEQELAVRSLSRV